MKKLIVEQVHVRGRPKYLHIALNFQSDFPNLIDLRAIFPQSQGPLAPGSERQENPYIWKDIVNFSVFIVDANDDFNQYHQVSLTGCISFVARKPVSRLC